ncbi:MAG TPA: hypothetical protein VEA69_17470 [Tepidisphaeraceae bacterium]|nr:hypothetical protein [Tepidisphaeraceae bacterium]
MSAAPLSARLRAEADLIEAFTRTYGRKFSEMIDQLNHPTPAAGAPAQGLSDLQCVRLCVEAVNMMLVSQAQVARTLQEMAAAPVAGALKAA